MHGVVSENKAVYKPMLRYFSCSRINNLVSYTWGCKGLYSPIQHNIAKRSDVYILEGFDSISDKLQKLDVITTRI